MTRLPDPRRLLLPAAVTAAAFAGARLADGLPPGADGAADLLRHLCGIAGWLALAWLGGRLFDVILHRAVSTATQPVQYPRVLGDLVRGVLFALALIAILVFVFAEAATGLIATSSVLIAVIGFALRSIIADLFSGIALNFEHPYRLGDWVEPAPGTVGKVVEINWRATRLMTREGTCMIVPNGVIAAARFVNYSYPEAEFRTSLRVAVEDTVPVERAKRILLAGALDAGRSFPHLRPDVLLQEFNDSGALYVVRFWVPDYGQENICRDTVAAGVLHSLHRSGLALSFPKKDVALSPDRSKAMQVRLPRGEVLSRIELFQAFEEEERQRLADHMNERVLPSGSIVVRQGVPGPSLFILAEGAADVSASVDGHDELTLDRLVPGDVFGEVSLLTGQPRSATVTAATDVVLYEIRKEHLDPILQARPAIAESLAAIMAERQRHNAARVAGSATVPDAVPSAADFLGRLRSFFGLEPRI